MPHSRDRFNPGRRRILHGLIAAPLVPLAVPAVAAKQGIAGQTAPELHANFWINADGEPTQFSLTEQRGRWVHVKCWQSWCPGCHAHGFPALQRMVKAFEGDSRVVNVAVQTVFEGHAINSADKVRKAQLRYSLPITFGHDPGKTNRTAVPRPCSTSAPAVHPGTS